MKDNGAAPLDNAYAEVKGYAMDAPAMHHKVAGQPFYLLCLCVRRLSGIGDEIPVILPERLFAKKDIKKGDLVFVSGPLRTHWKSGGIGRLTLFLFARSVCPAQGECLNHVALSGMLWSKEPLRKTPLGREIAGVCVSVKQKSGKQNKFPCILWGKDAKRAARLWEDCRITVTGRLQSRSYIKRTQSGEEVCMTHEISCSSFHT